MRTALVVVGLLVVVAGCTTPFGGDTATETTLTPADVPDSRNGSGAPVAIEESFEPLLATHDAVIMGQYVGFSARYPGPDRRNLTNATGFVGPNASAYLVSVAAPNAERGLWSNGTLSVSFVGSSVESFTFDIISNPSSRPSLRTPLFRPVLERAVVTDVTETDSGYLVTGSPADDSLEGTLLADERAENVTVTVRVASSGVIERYRLTWDYVGGNDGRLTSADVRLDTGAETVPRPLWVETALENTVRDGDTITAANDSSS